MRKIDLIELDQFKNIAVSRSWITSDIKCNKFKIDFGDFSYVFDYDGRLLESNQTIESKEITMNDLLTLKKDNDRI